MKRVSAQAIYSRLLKCLETLILKNRINLGLLRSPNTLDRRIQIMTVDNIQKDFMAETLDMTFLKPFIDGTLYTIKVQTGVEPTLGKPYLKQRDSVGLKVDIAGTVGIWSDKFKGSIYVCFPEKTYLLIMGKMLGEEYTSITSDIEDGAGEMMNIIFGFAKKVLNERGHNLEKALPGVIVGGGLKVSQVGKDPVIVLPFETVFGPFQLEIGIAS
jgi:chemotaxis protein CheX